MSCCKFLKGGIEIYLSVSSGIMINTMIFRLSSCNLTESWQVSQFKKIGVVSITKFGVHILQHVFNKIFDEASVN